MPALSPTMTTGTIGSWNVEEGGTVKSGEVMASIETDKAAVDFEVNEDTIVAKILQEAGTSDLPCGTVIAIAADDEDEIAELQAKDKSEFIKEVSTKTETAKTPEPVVEKKPEPTPTSSSTKSTKPQSTSSGEKTFISPVMKVKYQDKMAQIDALWQGGFRGSGPSGRIVLKDESVLENALKQPAATATIISTSAGSSIPVTQTNFDYEHVMTNVDFKMIKREMATISNSSVPHQYINHEVSIDNTMKFIERINSMNPKEQLGDLKSLILQAVSKSAMDCEYARYKWFGTEIRCQDHVNLSLHVGNKFKVFKSAETIGMTSWGTAMVEGLNEIKQKDTLDGNMSVRLDSTGYELCQNNESIFLGVSGVIDQMALNGSEPFMSKKLLLYSSFDHRTIDGAEAAQQLNKLKGYIQYPESMLL